MTEVFLVEKNVKMIKCPNCGGVHMPVQPAKKSGGGQGLGKGIRASGADGDPFKTGATGEHFETDHGHYCMFKMANGYQAHFIDKAGVKATQLGSSPSRREMIDVVLGHHDQMAAGLL